MEEIKKSRPSLGVGQETELAAFNNVPLSKAQIREGIKLDLTQVYITVNEILASKECLDALADVFYKKYLKIQESKKAQPELNLEQK